MYKLNYKKRVWIIKQRLKIEKVLIRNNMVKPNIKKQKPRKWVRYELPNPNDLWHTDWSYDPLYWETIKCIYR